MSEGATSAAQPTGQVHAQDEPQALCRTCNTMKARSELALFSKAKGNENLA